jgi:PKHD-type hydroxylase
MFHVIDGLFDAPTLAALREAARDLPYEDGRRTAGALARAVKDNAQAPDSPARAAVLARVEAALAASPAFQSLARPRLYAGLRVSRYTDGQVYGSHVDDALMPGGRADLSFTLFLSDPDSYRGGALVVEDAVEDRAVKLPAGELVLYPSDTLHRVEPVTTGTRLAVVGWVESWLRDPRQRAILHDLDTAVAGALAAEGPTAPQVLRLARVRSNLLRLWAG